MEIEYFARNFKLKIYFLYCTKTRIFFF